jgi:hypothetical protein
MQARFFKDPVAGCQCPFSRSLPNAFVHIRTLNILLVFKPELIYHMVRLAQFLG